MKFPNRRMLLVLFTAMAVLAVPTTASASLSTTQKKAIQKVGSDAYMYGYAPVYMQRNVSRFPANMVINVQYIATDETRSIVKPNADTLYTLMVLNVGTDPVIVHTPPTGSRYFALELLDGHTNVFGYIGNRTTGNAGGNYALVGPNWNATTTPLNRSVDGIIRSATPRVWIIGRTLVDSQADVASALAIQNGISAQLNSKVTANEFLPPFNMSAPGPTGTPTAMTPVAGFFKEFGTTIAAQPALASEAKLMTGFAKYGIGPGLDPTKTQSAATVAELVKGAVAAQAKIDAGVIAKRISSVKKNNGWILFDGIGIYGKDYLTRSIIAQFGLGANVPAEAIYPAAVTDYTGALLNGAAGAKYKLHFKAGGIPTTNGGFWSVTLYAQDQFFVANPLGRFAIGGRTPGLRHNTDGSTDLYISATQPTTLEGGAANWLPAPEAQFNLIFRIYRPTSSVLSSKWVYPKITKIS
ncbi:MAG: DUF1254 domain-containing protein [Solirubrobacterales bacterium]|nr:DUF1254 domain-containing protein [Solirubrobacterales bacterium]